MSKLKSSFWILFIFVTTAVSCFAQLENRFSIGPRVGINFATINQDEETRTGLVAGLTTTYSINEKSGITIDALFSSRGFGSGASQVKLNYLSIPILYDAFFGKLGEAFRPKLYAGFAPGFLLKAETGAINLTERYKSVTFDIVGGGGFNYRLASRVWLNVDLRALFGLANLTESGDDIRNRTIQVSGGLAYGL